MNDIIQWMSTTSKVNNYFWAQKLPIDKTEHYIKEILVYTTAWRDCRRTSRSSIELIHRRPIVIRWVEEIKLKSIPPQNRTHGHSFSTPIYLWSTPSWNHYSICSIVNIMKSFWNSGSINIDIEYLLSVSLICRSSSIIIDLFIFLSYINIIFSISSIMLTSYYWSLARSHRQSSCPSPLFLSEIHGYWTSSSRE